MVTVMMLDGLRGWFQDVRSKIFPWVYKRIHKPVQKVTTIPMPVPTSQTTPAVTWWWWWRYSKESVFGKLFHRQRSNKVLLSNQNFVNVLLGSHTSRKLSMAFHTATAKLAIKAGIIPPSLLSKNNVFPSKTLIIKLNPPKISFKDYKNAIRALDALTLKTVQWQRKLRKMLLGIEAIGGGANTEFLSSESIRVNGNLSLISSIIVESGLSAVEVTIQEDEKDSWPISEQVQQQGQVQEQGQENLTSSIATTTSSSSSLSLIFPHLYENELEAFSDISQVDLLL